VARAGLWAAGANLINDVSGVHHDPALAGVASKCRFVARVCVMHGPLDPPTMQPYPQL